MKNIDLFREFDVKIVKEPNPDHVYLYNVIEVPKLKDNGDLKSFVMELFINYGEKYTDKSTPEYLRAVRIYETCIDEDWAVTEFVEHTKNFIRCNNYANFTIADFFKEPRKILYTKSGQLKEYLKEPYLEWRIYDINEIYYYQKVTEPQYAFLEPYRVKPITNTARMLPVNAEKPVTTFKDYVKGLWKLRIADVELKMYIEADKLPEARKLYKTWRNEMEANLTTNKEAQIKALRGLQRTKN